MTNLPVHIAHVTFDMRIGGAERVISTLVRNTDATRFTVSIICLDQHIGPFGKELSRKGIPIQCFNRRPGFDTALIAKIRHYLHARQIDLLHCHQYTPYVYGVLAAAFTRTRVIFTEHGRFYPDRRKLKRVWVNPLLSTLTSATTAISAATKQALVENENLKKKRIVVIYNGIDDIEADPTGAGEIKSELGIGDGGFVLGTVARMDENKNQAMMVRAFHRAIATNPNLYLVIVGDGPERRNIESLVRDLNLEERILMTGFRQDACRFYQIFDAFLLTSHTEGTAMTLLEAMSAGIPCIATNVGGTPEIVADARSGFLVQDDDDRELARVILKLTEEGELAKQLGRSSRKRFEDHFSADKMVSQYQQLYTGILGIS